MYGEAERAQGGVEGIDGFLDGPEDIGGGEVERELGVPGQGVVGEDGGLVGVEGEVAAGDLAEGDGVGGGDGLEGRAGDGLLARKDGRKAAGEDVSESHESSQARADAFCSKDLADLGIWPRCRSGEIGIAARFRCSTDYTITSSEQSFPQPPRLLVLVPSRQPHHNPPAPRRHLAQLVHRVLPNRHHLLPVGRLQHPHVRREAGQEPNCSFHTLHPHDPRIRRWHKHDHVPCAVELWESSALHRNRAQGESEDFVTFDIHATRKNANNITVTHPSARRLPIPCILVLVSSPRAPLQLEAARYHIRQHAFTDVSHTRDGRGMPIQSQKAINVRLRNVESVSNLVVAFSGPRMDRRHSPR